MQKILGTAAAALAFIGAPAQAEFTFQRITFETQALHGSTLQLSIGDAVSGGTGHWATPQYPSVTNNLAAAACTSNGDQKAACFQSFLFPTTLTDSKAQASGKLPSQDVSSTTAASEPNMYALMLAGLGTFAFMARRRRVVN